MKQLFALALAVLTLTESNAQLAGNNNNNNTTPVVFARVDPTGVTGTATGTGIPSVTQTNLTQTTTAVAQSFFWGGGIALDPPANRQTPLATASPGAGAVLVNNTAKRFNEYRNQLATERLRLVRLIENKRRARQPVAIETARVIAVERAILQTDQQMALRGMKETTPPAPARSSAARRY